MRNPLLFCFILLAPWAMHGQETYALAPPLMRYTSVFYDQFTAVTLHFAQPGTQIHYTLDGTEPTEQSPIYTQALKIKGEQTTLKAKVFGNGFLPSETVSNTFYAKGQSIKAIEHSTPHPKYQGMGVQTLIDGQGGSLAHSSKTWVGFQLDTLEATLHLKKAHKSQKLLFHVLVNQGAWIFAPQQIEVWGRHPRTGLWVRMGSSQWPNAQQSTDNGRLGLEIPLTNRIKTKEIKIKATTLSHLPDWHPGKGQKPWLFVEEVGVY